MALSVFDDKTCSPHQTELLKALGRGVRLIINNMDDVRSVVKIAEIKNGTLAMDHFMNAISRKISLLKS